MAAFPIPPPVGASAPPPAAPPPSPPQPQTPPAATPKSPAAVPPSFDALFDQAQKSEVDGRDESSLARYPENMRSTIRRLADYKLPLPPRVQNDPYWQTALTAAGDYDPSFNVSDYANRQALKKSFETGKHADNITSFNTAIGHLSRMRDSGDALHNRWAPAWNAIANTFDSSVLGSPEVGRYEQDANAVAGELTRAFRGTGGAESDVQAWRKQMSHNGSPSQLHANVDEAIQLLKSRIQELQDQYRQGMGKNPPRFLSDNARKVLQRMGYNADEIEGVNRTPQQGAPNATAPTDAMINVQIPGFKPGQIHASQREKFLTDHPGAKVLP